MIEEIKDVPLQRAGPRTDRKREALTSQASPKLHAIHDYGILNADLNSNNILKLAMARASGGSELNCELLIPEISQYIGSENMLGGNHSVGPLAFFSICAFSTANKLRVSFANLRLSSNSQAFAPLFQA